MATTQNPELMERMSGFYAWAKQHAVETPQIGVLEQDPEKYPEQRPDVNQLLPTCPLSSRELYGLAAKHLGGEEVVDDFVGRIRPAATELSEIVAGGENAVVMLPHLHLMDVVEAAVLVQLARGGEARDTARQIVFPVNKAMAFEKYGDDPILRVMARLGVVSMVVPATQSVGKYHIDENLLKEINKNGFRSLVRDQLQDRERPGRMLFVAPYGTRLRDTEAPPPVADALVRLFDRYFAAALPLALNHGSNGNSSMDVGEIQYAEKGKSLSEQALRGLGVVTRRCVVVV